jgi:hypothetical protein
MGYGGKTHETDSQSSDTTAFSGRELHHLQFSLQAASSATFGYTLVWCALKTGLYLFPKVGKTDKNLPTNLTTEN